jgi:peptide/nickel transport system ATP-binding protein
MVEEQQEQIKTKNDGEEYLRVENLVTRFFTSKGIVKALDGVSLSVKKGEVFGLVGESGCGKSVTATSIMDLIPDPPGRIISGSIRIDDYNILNDLPRLAKIDVKSETDVRVKRNKKLIKRHNFVISKIRGNKIAMIFQEPSLALNPVISIGKQITENILLHNRVEIANSIIRRESLTEADIKSFYEQIKDEKGDFRPLVNSWTRQFAVPVAEDEIVNILRSGADREMTVRELSEVIMGKKRGNDLNVISTMRDYYKREEELFNLTLKLLEAESQNDQNRIALLEQQISNLRYNLKKDFSSFLWKRRFFRKKYEAVFEDEARRRALELLTLVNIAEPTRVYDSYPHELSGGMQQRAMIAMAIASNPMMLIADEPTTALDVTTQAQILDLIRDLNKVTGTSVLFITHDLAVIAEMCERLGVMYAGNLVEEGPASELFNNPLHPYTTGLLSSIPRADVKSRNEIKLESIPGSVPNLITPPSGCRFHPRCKFKMDICAEKKPALVEVQENHKVACFLYSKEVEN